MFALKIHEKDNVATVFSRGAAAGERIQVTGREGDTVLLELVQDIPYGHKAALVDIPAGSPVIKYGEVIGKTSQPVPKGGHVHIHNLESNRARGDLAKGGDGR